VCVCVLRLRDGGENDLGLGRGCGRRLYMTAWCWPGGRAGHRAAHSTGSCPCPCCVMGQGGGPCTALAFGSCWHGHAACRAKPGRATGSWAVWKYIELCWLVGCFLVRRHDWCIYKEKDQGASRKTLHS
jgi:hypothetical protein